MRSRLPLPTSCLAGSAPWDPATASEYSYMLSDIGQVVNAAEIIAGEKPVTDLGVTAVDDKTLEVQLNVPVSYFLSLMYFPTFYPVNEAFYNTCKDTFGTSPDTVLSNGAFKLTTTSLPQPPLRWKRTPITTMPARSLWTVWPIRSSRTASRH